MLRIIFLIGSLLSIVSFFIPALWPNWSRPPQWEWDTRYDLSKSNPQAPKYFELLKHSDGQHNYLLRLTQKPLAFPKSSRIAVPIFGDGYFQYTKLGKELSYYTKEGEELWRKDYPYYPAVEHYGRLVLLFTGDSGRVDLINSNALPIGAERLYGAFLSDYDFAIGRAWAALVFSSGESYVVRQDGGIAYMHNFYNSKVKQNLFIKSCALSADGQLLAVHLLMGSQDHLIILAPKDEVNRKEQDTYPTKLNQVRIIRDITLPHVWPHILHITLNHYGVLVAAPQQTLYYYLDNDTQKDWQTMRNCDGECSVYRPVWAGKGYFIYTNDTQWKLLDKEGALLGGGYLALDLYSHKQYRFLPVNAQLKREGEMLGLQSGFSVQYFHYKNN